MRDVDPIADKIVEAMHEEKLLLARLARKYTVGSVIEYAAFDGERRVVMVTEKSEDIKNGRPGFGGHLVGDPRRVWGYDSQIIGVRG